MRNQTRPAGYRSATRRLRDVRSLFDEDLHVAPLRRATPVSFQR